MVKALARFTKRPLSSSESLLQYYEVKYGVACFPLTLLAVATVRGSILHAYVVLCSVQRAGSVHLCTDLAFFIDAVLPIALGEGRASVQSMN